MAINTSYAILLILRLLVVLFGFGYIHPDSYFQSSEVVASDVFGFETVRTWEFDPSHPSRTIFTPAIISGIPFLVLKALSYVLPNIVNPFTLLYFPRLFLYLSSFILDGVVWQLSGKDWDALYTLGSSWALFAMINNSFSNTTETLILSIALWWVFRKGSRNWTSHAVFGALLSVGVFNRFTFFFYALPLICYLIYEEIIKKDKGDLPSLITGIMSGFTSMSMVIVLVDSVYYGSVSFSVGNKLFRWLDLLCPSFYTSLFQNLGDVTIHSFTWTMTPINSITYNSKLDNLASHGTHLRITHLLWNLPLLFGPLAYTSLAPYYFWLDDQLGVLIGQQVPGSKKKTVVPLPKIKKTPTDKATKSAKLQDYKFSSGKLTIVAVAVSGLVFLSIVPHQEMRFLLPMLVPLVLLGYKGIFGNEGNIWWKGGFIGFNIALFLFMVVFHQGGVIPSILKIASQPVEAGSTIHSVYFHTYMPPQYLFGIKQTSEKPKFAVYDLKGGEVPELRKTLLRITEGINFGAKDIIYIVAPATVDLSSVSDLTIKRRQWLHFTSEDAPEWSELNKLVLNIYQYSIPPKGTSPTTTEKVDVEITQKPIPE